MSAQTRDGIHATWHARDRFHDRASDPTDSVLAAWRDGEPLAMPEEAPLPHNDELRYDRVSDVVVCRRDAELTTVYGLTSECISNIYGVAVAAAVDAQFGTDYRSGIDAANLEDTR